MERVYHLIGDLRKYPERWIMIDSSEPGCVEGEEQYPEAKQREMNENYPDVVEEIDPRAPKPKGKEIKTACFFDAAMGSKMTKGRGHTGITLFVGRTPVSCISKRQGTAEASSYGSEFIARCTFPKLSIFSSIKSNELSVSSEGAGSRFSFFQS